MQDDLRDKIQEVNDTLEAMFGVAVRDDEEDPLSCLIHTILSQNTNDVNSGAAYANLRRKFRSWEAVLHADREEIINAIRVGGLSNQKSETIKRVLTWLHETRGELNLDFICEMSANDAIELLLPIKGVGLKTISVTLCFACGKEVFPVDTHIFRVSKRLGLIPQNASADRAHQILGELCPPGKAFPLHVNLIRFGRQICHARQPECDACPLLEECVWISN